MFRKFTLSLILTICAITASKFSFAITYIDNGTNTDYNLTAADSLHIAVGTYTGDINSFPAGAKISVSDMAIFQPASMPNNTAGTIYNYGTATITQATFRTNTNFALHNYGIFTVNGATVMNGNSQVWTNYFGAVINFNGAVTVNGTDENNTIINHGTVNASAMVTMTSGAQLINYKNFNVTGEFRVNGGTLENRGKIVTTGLLNFNNGAAVIHNYCSMSSLGGIRNTSNNFYNYSYIWARNDLGLGHIENTATIYNLSWNYDNISIPIIHGRSIENRGGTITGNGYMYFYGTTTQSGGAITGASGVTTDTIKMYDINRANASTIYDVQGGTVHPNAIYNAWGIPDSTRAYLVGCSVEIILEVPLAINWNYFFVDLSNNIPALTWSADYDPGTTFEIQRSYNGRSFSAIKDVQSEVGRSEYKYNDGLVNNQAPVVYYRIKATQLNGEVKYSATRIVRFGSKKGVFINAVPNPFRNSFVINYNAVEKEMLMIRIFNVNGQQKLAKAFMVNSGNNSINITEAANLSSGLYVIQISNGESTISSTKIVKQ